MTDPPAERDAPKLQGREGEGSDLRDDVRRHESEDASQESTS